MQSTDAIASVGCLCSILTRAAIRNPDPGPSARRGRGPRRPPRHRLLAAAEDLVARHGPDAVSTRQILAAAGAGNMAAIQYHFGTKEGLLAAVVARVLEPLERGRAAARGALGA